MHDEAFGVAPGYEEFCEEFAGGNHDAIEILAAKVALLPVMGMSDCRTDSAEEVVHYMLEGVGDLADLFERMCLKTLYDAALADAWRDHCDERDG